MAKPRGWWTTHSTLRAWLRPGRGTRTATDSETLKPPASISIAFVIWEFRDRYSAKNIISLQPPGLKSGIIWYDTVLLRAGPKRIYQARNQILLDVFWTLSDNLC